MDTKELLIKTMQDNVRAMFDCSGMSIRSHAQAGILQASAEVDRIARILVNEFGMTYAEVEELQIV